MVFSNVLNDTFIRIKNGYRLNLDSVWVIKSKKVIKVLEVLQLYGYIKNYKQNCVLSMGNVSTAQIRVVLKYSTEGKGALRDIKSISKSGRRVYLSVDMLNYYSLTTSKLGCLILSTSKGIMSGAQARQSNVGGELLCYVL